MRNFSLVVRDPSGRAWGCSYFRVRSCLEPSTGYPWGVLLCSSLPCVDEPSGVDENARTQPQVFELFLTNESNHDMLCVKCLHFFCHRNDEAERSGVRALEAAGIPLIKDADDLWIPIDLLPAGLKTALNLMVWPEGVLAAAVFRGN